MKQHNTAKLTQPLTLSLPLFYLKTTNKSAKLGTLKPVCFLVRTDMYQDFNEKHSTESRCVIGTENILFEGMSVNLSARKMFRFGQ